MRGWLAVTLQAPVMALLTWWMPEPWAIAMGSAGWLALGVAAYILDRDRVLR